MRDSRKGSAARHRSLMVVGCWLLVICYLFCSSAPRQMVGTPAPLHPGRWWADGGHPRSSAPLPLRSPTPLFPVCWLWL